ncbi:MAG: AraC family transcriptional regulator [Bacteroidota bacterium]
MQKILAFYRNLHPKSAKLLTHSSQGSKSVFVDGIGMHETMPAGLVDRPGGTDGWLFMYFHDPVQILDETGLQEHPGRRMICWRPGNMHYYGNIRKEWTHSWIHLSGNAIENLHKQNPYLVNRAQPFGFPELFEQSLESIFNELEGPFDPDSTIIQNLVENLFRQLHRATTRKPAFSKVPENISQIKRYIDLNFEKAFSLKELSGISNLAPTYMCGQFRRCFGYPPIEYRTRVRIHHACEMLRDYDLPISEIAQRVGYSDVYHFSRQFKQQTNISPGRYRKQMSFTKP